MEYVESQVFWIDVDWEMVEVQCSSMGASALCSVWKFGSDAVVYLMLSRQWVVGVIKFLFAPESVTAVSDNNADTNIVDISFCK